MIIGSLVSAGAGIWGTIKTNKANKELAEMNNNAMIQTQNQNYDRNIELWRMQNQYNTPKNQITRLREAGINPILAIGGISNSSTPIQPGQPVQLKTAEMQNPLQNLGSMFGGIANIILQEKQAKQIEAVTKITDEQWQIDKLVKLESLKGAGLSNKKIEKEIEQITENIISKQLENTYNAKTINDRIMQIALENNEKEISLINQRLQTSLLKVEEKIKNQSVIQGNINIEKTKQEIENIKTNNEKLKAEIDKIKNEQVQQELMIEYQKIENYIKKIEEESYEKFQNMGLNPYNMKEWLRMVNPLK